MGLWYVGTGTAKMVGAVTSFGFQHYDDGGGGGRFRSWQIMFLVWGLVTVGVGGLVLRWLPDSPMTAARLSAAERRWAVERLRANMTGVENTRFKRAQVAECLADPQTYLLGLVILTSNVPNGFISSYQSTVIQSFGWSSKQTALLSIPSGAIAVCCTLAASWYAGRFAGRGPGIILLLALGCLGSCLMAFLPADGYVAGKMAGNYLANSIGSSLPLMVRRSPPFPEAARWRGERC